MTAPSAVTVASGHTLLLRDGVRMSVDLWSAGPAASLRRPVVVTLSPYGRDTCADTGRFFAERGFVFVAADCRGRGDSEGAFSVYGDADDYADLVAWTAAQPWCDGNVFAQGGSYAGINQWHLASRRPPALRAIAPMVAPMPGPWGDSFNGIVMTYNIAWATLVSGRSAKWSLFNDRQLWRDVAWRIYRERPATATLADCVTGQPNPVLAPMVAAYSPDRWEWAVPSQAEFAATTIPVLTITGLYDNAQVGTLQYWRRHEAADTAHRERRFLVIGPSAHAGTRPISAAGGTPDESTPLRTAQWQDELCAGFYRWAAGQGGRPPLLADRVSAYVVGLERWVHAPELPALSRSALVLHPCGTRLAEAATPADPVDFVNDPLDTRFAALEAQAKVGSTLDALSGENPRESGFAEHLFGQGHAWDGAELAAPVTLCGTPTLRLRIASETPDADLAAVLLQVDPDGRLLVLSATLLRLRHRDGLQAPPRPMRPGVAEVVAFPEFRFIAARIEAGSRLRLLLRVPASIAFERQLNAAIPVGEQALDDALAGRITVFADLDSALHLPLVDETLVQQAPTA